MPEITAVSLANVVAQAQARAQAGGYVMAAPIHGTDANPRGYQGRDQSGMNPQQLPPGRRSLGLSRILEAIQQLGRPRPPPYSVVGQTYGSFGQLGPPGPPPLCSDTRYYVDGAPPGNCVKTVPCSDTRYYVNGKPPRGCTMSVVPILFPKAPSQPPPTPAPPAAQPCTPQPCSPQPCMPQPCSPSPCVPVLSDGGPIGGPLGGMQVCPPCAPQIPWGWFVIASVFAFLGGLQFYGKVGGGKLS